MRRGTKTLPHGAARRRPNIDAPQMPHGPTPLLLLALSFTLVARAAEPAPALAAAQGQTQPAAPAQTPRPDSEDVDDEPDPLTYTDTVKVMAEKWEADPAKVPLSLTVTTPDELAASGAVLLNQVGPAVPGLFLRNDGDRSFNKPSLRGIISSPFNDPAVTVYVDDVPMDPRMGLATPLLDGTVRVLARFACCSPCIVTPPATAKMPWAAGGRATLVQSRPAWHGTFMRALPIGRLVSRVMLPSVNVYAGASAVFCSADTASHDLRRGVASCHRTPTSGSYGPVNGRILPMGVLGFT